MTIQHPFFTPESYEAASLRVFDDLDEKTSVLSGTEPGIEIDGERTGSTSASERPPPSVKTAKERSLENTGGHRLLRTRAQRETDRPKAPPPGEDTDARDDSVRSPSQSPPAASHASLAAASSPASSPSSSRDARETTAPLRVTARDGVTSYRVAIVPDGGGGVQLLLLRPGEVAAEGLATAFIVPTDQISSEAIAALLTRGGNR